MAGTKGMKKYSLEFRERVARERLEEGATIPYLQKKYGIKSQAQIVNWTKWYSENGTAKQVTGKRRGRPKVDPSSTEERLKFLEMENALLKKLNELLLEEETKRK